MAEKGKSKSKKAIIPPNEEENDYDDNDNEVEENEEDEDTEGKKEEDEEDEEEEAAEGDELGEDEDEEEDEEEHEEQNLDDGDLKGTSSMLDPIGFAFDTLEEAFRDWLQEGSIGLDKKQASNALFESGQNPTEADIDDYWKEKGKSDDDVITQEEMKELYERLGDPKAAIKEALMHFDKNKNGKIDREELRDILRATGALEHVATEDSYVDLILNLGDKNDDNELDIDELVTMIQDGLIKFKSKADMH